MSLVANEEFQHILRVLNTNVDGKQKIQFAMTSIKGIGRRFANICCKKADVDMNKRAGELSAAELDNIMTVVANPRQFKVPDWFLNRKKHYKDGKFSQVVSNQLDMKLRDDLERLKKIRRSPEKTIYTFTSKLMRPRLLGSVRSYAKHLRIDGVNDTIAIASGKGGVGKSTTAVNLAVALASKFQLKVGLLDADVYGPNIPIMMNIDTKPEVTQDNKMIPIDSYGIKCMSIGFLVEKNAPIVWRGPMVSKALEKMTRGVDWGNLDILVIDMPPGTGDVQISMSQNLQLSGALIVSTPQDVALMDARRGVQMFNKVDIPILGIIENMSCFKCPHCGEPSYIFGKGGAHSTSTEMRLNFLGEIPLEVEIREACDQGHPIVLAAPDSVVSRAYGNIAEKVVQKLKEKQFQPEILL